MMTAYKRQYRSTPRPQAIRGEDFAKCAAVLVGFITACWLIVFG